MWQKWLFKAVFGAFFRVFEMKFTWGKPMIHVEQKKFPQKSGIRNLAKATNENSISINARNNASKKPATFKKRDSLSKKQSKHRLL